MKIFNLINRESVDAQVIGIIILIPITSVEEQPLIGTFNKCKKCDAQSDNIYSKFCSICGSEIIEVTEQLKYFGYVKTQKVPLPDVREEIKNLINKEHLPFNDYIGTNDYWKFVYKEYKTIGHRSDFVSFVEEFDIKQIKNDLKEANIKLKKILEKYNGKVIFGIAGDFADW